MNLAPLRSAGTARDGPRLCVRAQYRAPDTVTLAGSRVPECVQAPGGGVVRSVLPAAAGFRPAK